MIEFVCNKGCFGYGHGSLSPDRIVAPTGDRKGRPYISSLGDRKPPHSSPHRATARVAPTFRHWATARVAPTFPNSLTNSLMGPSEPPGDRESPHSSPHRATARVAPTFPISLTNSLMGPSEWYVLYREPLPYANLELRS